MNYSTALKVLEERQEARVRLGLGRVRRLLRALGDPQESYPCVHVAGTNGKGSVCAMLDSMLRVGGARVGLYTSPHLADVRERIQVNGRKISPSEFARAMSRVLRGEREPLSYFELVTTTAFLHFRARRVDWAVLETGLGGRLDATNVVRRPAAALVTAIDYDHTDWLGDSLSSIAREKAGIFKPGCPALTAELKPAALRALRREALRRGTRLETIPRRPWRGVRVDWASRSQALIGPRATARVGLLGKAQPRNAALALETLDRLRRAGHSIPARAADGLSRVHWPGRFEVVRVGGRVAVLDGAHNPQAMRHFCATLDASPWRRSRRLFVLGMLRDKDVDSMLKELAPRVGEAVCARPASPRALDPRELARRLRAATPRADVSTAESVGEAIGRWRRGPARVLCVCGSFYLVSGARRALGLS